MARLTARCKLWEAIRDLRLKPCLCAEENSQYPAHSPLSPPLCSALESSPVPPVTTPQSSLPPVWCPSPSPQPVSELSHLPSHPRSNLLRRILPPLKHHPNLHLTIAEFHPPTALSPMRLTALHRRAPHTLLDLIKPTATTTPAPI